MRWRWIIGAIIIVCVVYLYYRYTTKEGFVTISNIQYPFKEVFLVAPTQNSEGGNKMLPFVVPASGTYNNRGYTRDAAQAVCESYGGDLATVAQIQKAYDNSGNWCIAGWSKDSTTRAYYLPSKIHTCGGNLPLPTTVPYKSLPTTDSPPQTLAFPICYAVKPPEMTPSITAFNETRYSTISSDFLNFVMTGVANGVATDIFPVSFTASQAYYAIDNSGTDTATNLYKASLARNSLIENYNDPYHNVDASILRSLGITDDPSQWSTLDKVRGLPGQASESCRLLKTQDDIVSGKVQEIKTAFRDVSGYVLAAVQSKAENMKIQKMLYNICSGTTPAQSPACAKLATIDFDRFYNTTQNTLSDLETLNVEIYTRREEVCQLLHNIRLIRSSLGCSYDTLIDECIEGCRLIPAVAATQTRPATPAIYDCSNTTIFDINNIGGLKYAMEEISPLFEVNAYKTLLTAALLQLSIMVESPIATNFTSTRSNINLINAAIRDVTSLLEEI